MQDNERYTTTVTLEITAPNREAAQEVFALPLDELGISTSDNESDDEPKKTYRIIIR